MSAVERIETTETVVPVPREPNDEAVRRLLEDERVELTPYEFNRPWHRAFMHVLARTGEVSSAARAVGVPRTYVYEVRKNDPVFRAAWEEANEVASDLLDQVAWRRATVGEEVVVTRTTRRFKDNELAEETVVEERSQRRSDTVLMFLMRARRPGLYGDAVTHRGHDGGPVQVEVYRQTPPDRLRALAALWAEEQGFAVHPDVEGSANGSPA